MLQKLSHGWSKMLGFTMVELMIVIAIIGIIAVAVLSAINPLEQINKGKDTRVRSDASEMLTALERYYATDEQYPWGVSAPAINSSVGWTAANVASVLVGQSELKSAFQNRIGVGSGQSNLTPYQGAVATDLYICFQPASAQFLREASKKFVSWPGGIPSGVTSTTYCMP